MSDSADTTANCDTEIPANVGEKLRIAHRLEERPRTLTEWGRAIGEVVRREDIDVELTALCTTEQSPHVARFGGTTQHFACVQDAFIVPAVVTDVETVEIRTKSPVSGDPIDVTVTGAEIESDPDAAVMSVGVAADISDPPADADSPAIAYGKICPYGHAFVSRAEYEQWAETVDAVTMVAPLEDAFQLARAIGNATP